MANPNTRLSINAPGPFYVDDSCVDCDMCRCTAPGVFARDAENSSSYVVRQPVTAEELALAREAVEGCPSESIGIDEPAVGIASTAERVGGGV